MKDQLVECKRCKGNACYEQYLDENIVTWLCMGCGFTTSSLLKEGGKVAADLIETSPSLYKDLLYTDDERKVWAPSTLTLPKKGMVFLDGTSKKEWKWAAVQAIEITNEEREVKNFPADQTHRWI